MSSKKRRRKQMNMALAGLLVAAALGGGVAWWWTGPRAEAEARERAATALAGFERCYFGAPGIAAEDAWPTVRGTVIAVALAGEADEPAWPARCEPSFTELRDALGASGDDEAIERLRAASATARLLGVGLELDLSEELAAWVRAARAAPLPAVAAPSEGSPPPAPATFVASDALAELASGDELLALEHAPESPTFVIREGGEEPHAIACALEPQGDDDARCGPPVEGEELRALGRLPGAPVVLSSLAVIGDDATLISGADGRELGRVIRPGIVSTDGAIRGIRFQGEGKPLLAVRHPADADEQTTPLEPPFFGAVPSDALVADSVAAVRWEEPGKRAVVLLYPIDDEGIFGAPRTLEVSDPLHLLCPVSDAWALVTRSNDDAWAVHVSTASGATSHPIELASDPEVWCFPGAVSFTATRDDDGDRSVSVQITRCDAEGCTSSTGRAEPPLAGDVRARALDLGDKVLVLYAGTDRPTIALTAALDALGEATPRVIADAPSMGGPNLSRASLVPHRRGALVAFHEDGRWRAVVVDPTGIARAARVAQPAAAP